MITIYLYTVIHRLRAYFKQDLQLHKHGNRQLTMQKLHILHYPFDFTTAQIVINCTLKYALHRP